MTNQTISPVQRAVLQNLIDTDNRVAFYLKLNEYTGSKTALLMAEISSSSSIVGGAAWAINNAYSAVVPGYWPGGVDAASRVVAAADNRLIRVDPNGTGRFIVPSDQQMLVGAYNTWAEQSPGLGVYFPGNALIAANYLTAGEPLLAAPFAGYAAVSGLPLAGLGLGDVYWELFGSRLNAGRSVQEYLDTNPGSTRQVSANGNVVTVIGADGKTLGAFVSNFIGNALPLNIISQTQGLITDGLVKGYELWNSMTGTQGGAGSMGYEMPMLDALGNFIGFEQSASAVVSSARDAANSNYMIDVYENGTQIFSENLHILP